ncbi:MAG: hypothetical protein KF795_00340 [Labilithrix sp.]|nr:hypothetical protein [Labilithrix sp.]
MKFSPWQLVAVLAILFAAIILAHVFTPGAAATIVSMATTVFAALFVHRDGGGPPPPAGPGGPALKVLNGGLAAVALAAVLVGCGPSFSEIETAIAGDAVSEKLAKCRDEARTAYYAEKKSKDDALARYESCKQREGLQ